MCENNEISIGLNCLNDLRDYKNNSNFSSRKGYYLRNNIESNLNLRNEIYNKLVLNGINSEINIEELINSYVKELINS